MVYLAELLVVMTDGLKIVRICARNSPVHGHKHYTTRFSRLSRSSKSNGVACSMNRGAVLLKQKNRLETTCLCLAVASNKEVAATVCPLHFDTKSKQSDCKSVLGKSSVR